MDFLKATWRYLPFANFKVDPSFLQEYVPKGCRLQVRDGKADISVVGLRFENTRILGIPVPGHINFSEINLRIYVEGYKNGELKPGVSFIKEIVSKPIITWVANNLYDEHYDTMPIDYELQPSGKLHPVNERITYSWKPKDQWMRFSIDYDPKELNIVDNSNEQFILERYYGFSEQRGKTSCYEVKHASWNYHKVEDYKLQLDFEQTYGSNFAMLNQLQPDSVMMAQGSRIGIGKKSKLR